MTRNSAPELHLYLLQRRGQQVADGRVNAMIVGAISEAHARVYAADRHPDRDVTWGEDGQTSCVRIVLDDNVLHTLYNPKTAKR